MLTVLSQQNSIVSQYLRELRDVEIQKDAARFEHNLERIGLIAGYELSKSLNYHNVVTTTPLGKANTPVIRDEVVICTILRAGLPVQRGIYQILDAAALAFIAAGRKPDISHGVEIDLAYVASPGLAGKVLVLADTMLATGFSIVDAYTALVEKHGRPERVVVVCVIGAQPGIDYVRKHVPEVEIMAAAVDPELNDDYFIVPGLGDAGDLLYGPKL